MFSFSFWATALPFVVLAALFVAYRFLTRTTAISPVHAGKQDTHRCKFDVAALRRRGFAKKPVIDISNLPPQDARVAALMQAITTGDTESLVKQLSGEADVTVGGKTLRIASRSSYGPGWDNAMTWLEQFYDGLNIKHTRIKYKKGGKNLANLEAEIPGTSRKVLIIGAHLDSTAGGTGRAESVAPGADDDASGTVALMLIAKAITELQKSGAKIGLTIRFVHFTGEEQGLWGSYTYSDKVAKDNTDVEGVLQMDMIGYRAKKDRRVDLHDDVDRNGSHRLVVVLTRAAAQYKLDLQPFDTHDHAVHDRSDQAGFLDHGYQALCISEEFSEDPDAFNPNYHSTGDRVSAMNLPYMVEIIRMVLAGVVELAEVK